MSILQDRWPTVPGFCAAVELFWGFECVQVSVDRQVVVIRCPVCKPPSRDWREWPLTLGRTAAKFRGKSTVTVESWTHFAACGCSDEAIVAALVRFERDRLDRELSRLAA
jgi:hypothetical protein